MTPKRLSHVAILATHRDKLSELDFHPKRILQKDQRESVCFRLNPIYRKMSVIIGTGASVYY